MREALFPVGALISTTGKVLEVPPLSVSRAINQEPKTSWVAATSLHPRYRARTRPAHARNHVFPRAPGPPFHLPAIQRINAPRLPFAQETHPKIPAAFRIRMCPPPIPIRDARAIAGYASTGTRKKGGPSESASPDRPDP